MNSQQKRILTGIELNSLLDNKFLIQVLKTTIGMLRHNIRMKIFYGAEKIFKKKEKEITDKIW